MGFDDSVFSPESYDLSVKCDDKGRVISVTAMDKNRETGQDATYSYHYDSDGRFTKYHFKGDTVSDSTPRPETIVQFLYHSDGTRERRYDKNNEDVSYTARRLWDASGRLILIEHQNRGYTYPAQRLELDYDEEGSFIGSRLYENGKLVSQQEDMSWFEPWDYIVEDAHELSPADQELADAADFLERADETQRDENGNLISGYIYDKEGKLIKSGEFRYVYYEPQT